MKQRRTDLALEARELWQENAGETTRLEGVAARETLREGMAVTRVDILDGRGEKALGKPRGTYVTVMLEGVAERAEDAPARAARAVAAELAALLPAEGTVLVAGLGNRAVTPDAIGPRVHERVLVTRHLVEEMPERFGALRPVASLAAEVLGNTGVESGAVVRAVCEAVRPACVIAVDALAARSMERLCRAVQIADTGIVPGSGVGNHRVPLTRESLGVPVIALGVPTVVDGATLAADLLGSEEGEVGRGLLVTPKDIDSRVADLSAILSRAINLALQPGLTEADLEQLLE